MIAVVDYGVGNLYSLTCSLRHLGAEALVTREEEALRRAERVILPGVGAFGDAAERLRVYGLDRLLCDMAGAGKPLMGICLGMQLLFRESFEYGRHKGLGLIGGEIRPLAPALKAGSKVPHMGWNSLRVVRPGDPLLRGVGDGAFVYYVHSFYATACDNAWVALSDYEGAAVPGVVRRGNVCGTQFHPEKSGKIGLQMLSNFVKGEALC
jgi:glutamine amidotransferase